MCTPEYLIATAKKWRENNQECQGGVVLIWQGKAYGWKDGLRNPEQEIPGSLAIDDTGRIYVVEDRSGAEGAPKWLELSQNVN